MQPIGDMRVRCLVRRTTKRGQLLGLPARRAAGAVLRNFAAGIRGFPDSAARRGTR